MTVVYVQKQQRWFITYLLKETYKEGRDKYE